MADIYRIFSDYIKENNIINEHDHIIIGLSGGADSMCLTVLLSRLAREMKIGLTAVHVNHQLRGLEADEDEEFVKDFCKKRDVRCVAVNASVRSYAYNNNLSIEEAGRIARYQTFYQVARKISGQDDIPSNIKAAVAHHMDDNAETILLNLARGTGMSGLSGMQPVSGRFGITVIRPLLCISRNDIEAFLKDEKIEYRTDSTNNEDGFARNKVRLNIIPQLNKINNRASEHINEAAGAIVQAQDFIEEESRKACQIMLDERSDGLYIDLDRFAPLHPAVKGQVIRDAIMQMTGSLKDIGRVHIESVLELENKQTGKKAELPYGLLASRSYGNLIIRQITKDDMIAGYMTDYATNKQQQGNGPAEENAAEPDAYTIDPGQLPAETITYSLWGDMEVTCRLVHVNPVTRQYLIAKNEYTKAFDCAKIKGNLVLRKPEQGDVIQFSGGRKTIRKFFVDEKIPQEERKKTIVLCDESQVMWIIGRRMSEAFKISDMTNLALQISIIEDKEEGEPSL